MKTRINPVLGVGIAVVVLGLFGWFLYRSTSRQETDTSASLSPEMRAKIIGAYGGAPRGSAPPTQGNR